LKMQKVQKIRTSGRPPAGGQAAPNPAGYAYPDPHFYFFCVNMDTFLF